MSISNLTRRLFESFAYADGNLIGQSAGGQSWEIVSAGLAGLVISNGTAQTSTTATVGSVLRSASFPDKWANGFTASFDLKTDSLTLGHNHFDIQFGANTSPGTNCVSVIFNSADLNTANLDILDNIHIYNPTGSGDTYINLIPFTQNVTHHVVVTFTPNSLTTTQGMLKVAIDGVERVNLAVDFAGVTDGVFTVYGFATTVSRWTIDNLEIISTYPVGRATAGGVAVFPQGIGGGNRVLGYRTYNAPSTLAPNNHTQFLDLGTLADNLTIANPVDDGSGFAEGQKFEVLFKTSVDGTKTLAFGTFYKFGTGATSAATLATTVALLSKNVRVLFEYDSVLAAFVCTRQVYGH